MYGLCLFLGVLLAIFVGERLCKRDRLDTQLYWRAVFYALVLGLLGARLYHVSQRIDYFTQHRLEVVAVWQGGLGIWGGILGGLAGLLWATRKTGKFWVYADVVAVVAPLAQAIGRWGNYFNKELFGFPTSLPWGIYIPQELRPTAFKYFDRFHPLFLYGSLLNLSLFIVLYRLYYQRKKYDFNLSNGSILMLYLAGYSTIRFFLEFMRPESWRVANFPVASLLSLAILMLILILLFISHIKANKRQHKENNST